MHGLPPAPRVYTAHPTRIILTGFMGAGKTTVGALLAQRLGWDFVDSDRVVEARTGMAVAEIFARHGETAFREMEAAAVREASSQERLVLALGGGALERGETRAFLASQMDTLLVFLEAPLETMIARCAGHEKGPVRPVLADRARLAERWNQRLPWYRQAHLTVETGGLSAQAVVERIVENLDAEAAPVAGRGRGKPGATA